MGKGFLGISLFAVRDALPAGGMQALIKDTYGKVIHELTADKHGNTEIVTLEAADCLDPSNPFVGGPRFSVYFVEIPSAKGFRRIVVHGVQIFHMQTSILPIQMQPMLLSEAEGEVTDQIFIPLAHGADDPPRDMQDTDSLPAIALLPANEVAIPSYITVHLGFPNAAAPNVRVSFTDYIKNVASSEIFPTWGESAIYANIYCQISFALNRVYTLWYRSRGFEFDITNTTQFDQFFVEGRNLFENISQIVDDIFNQFLRREGRREPFFAQYCDGVQSTCNGLSQWGSQALSEQGYTTIEILHSFFPQDVQIVESNHFASDVGIYPGVALKTGSYGADVRTMQIYLNRISGNFFIPPAGVPDGYFGETMRESVVAFQEINFLVADGIIGKSTWYAITKVYVGVRQLAELESEGERIGIGRTPPTSVLTLGSRGSDVIELQFLLNFISEFYPVIPFVVEDGVFRESTKRSVIEFQQEFGILTDGVVGPATWSKLYEAFWSIKNTVAIPH